MHRIVCSTLVGVVALLSAVPSSRGAAAADAEVLTARIQELTDAIAARPGDAELRIEIGNLYYENGLLDQALASYVEATRIDSLHVGARLNLGSVYADKGDGQAALKELKHALRLDPSNPMIYTNLGSTHYGLQQYNEAVDMYRTALSLDPNHVEAHFNLAVSFADAQLFDEAIREWQKVIELAPGSDAARVSADNVRMIEEFRGTAN